MEEGLGVEEPLGVRVNWRRRSMERRFLRVLGTAWVLGWDILGWRDAMVMVVVGRDGECACECV